MDLSSGNEIPLLEPKLFCGISQEIQGNAHFVDDNKILHPAGKIIVVESLRQHRQKFIKVPSKNVVTVICISLNRKFIVVGEKGEKPTLSVYELSTLKRLKILGNPDKSSGAKDWASVGFTKDCQHLVAVSGSPEWRLLLYDWNRGKVESTSEATHNNIPVLQVVTNPYNNWVVAIVGAGLFRQLSYSVSESVWRQYGFSGVAHVPLTTAAWVGIDQILLGSTDGRIILVDYGELKDVYQAQSLTEIHIQRKIQKSQDIVNLASNSLSQEEQSGVHEVRALVSFAKGFAYSSKSGEVYVFEECEDSRWIRKNVIRIPSLSLSVTDYQEIYRINFISVNPSKNKLICTANRSEIYISEILGTTDGVASDFKLEETGFHDGPIVALSSCQWKPIFLTAGAQDKTVKIWNYRTRKVVLLKRFSDEIHSATLHPSGFYCLLGFTDKLRFLIVLVNDLKTIQTVDIRGCKKVAFSVGGQLFAATRDQNIEIYSAITFSSLHVLSGHLGPISAMVFNQNDKIMWSCGEEGALYQWDLENKKRISDIFTSNNGHKGLSVTKNEMATYTVGTDGNLKEIISKQISREVDMHQSSLHCVTLGNSGQMLFVGGEKGNVVSILYPLVHPPKWLEFSMHSSPVTMLNITHDDSVLISVSKEGFLCIWEIICDRKPLRLQESTPLVTDLLISYDDLKWKSNIIEELTTRLKEVEGEHEYSVKQTTSSYESTIREIQATNSSTIDELKFKIKQMDREHLVELNDYETKLSEVEKRYEEEIEKQEKKFSEKLLAEYKKHDLLQTQNSLLKEDFSKKIIKIEKEACAKTEAERKHKDQLILEKDLRIKRLEEDLLEARNSCQSLRADLEKQFTIETSNRNNVFEIQLQQFEKSKTELKNENGMLIKINCSLKEKIKEMNDFLREKEAYIISLKREINIKSEELELMVSALDKRNLVIGKKEEVISNLKKKNKEHKNEILYTNSNMEGIIKKIEPKELELKDKEKIIEEKNTEISKLHSLVGKKCLKIATLKRKFDFDEKEVKKQKKMITKMKNVIKGIALELQSALTNIFQPYEFKKKIHELSENLLVKYEHEIEEDEKLFKVMTKQREHMEQTIAKLRRTLDKRNPQAKEPIRPNKIALELLSAANRMGVEIRENRKKITFLETLLRLAIKRCNKYNNMPKDIFVNSSAKSDRQRITELEKQVKILEAETVRLGART